jgi:hypothetical protein
MHQAYVTTPSEKYKPFRRSDGSAPVMYFMRHRESKPSTAGTMFGHPDAMVSPVSARSVKLDSVAAI